MDVTAFFITMMDETNLAGQKYKADPKKLQRVVQMATQVMTLRIKCFIAKMNTEVLTGYIKVIRIN